MIDKYIADILEYTKQLVDRYGPRLPGSDACINTAATLEQDFARICNRTFLQRYDQSPDSFFTIPKIMALVYSTASILTILQADWLYPACFIYVFGLVYFIHQFIFMGCFFDRLFKKTSGYNVVGIIEPVGEARQQIIIGGHHDSVYVCNFLEKNQSLYGIRIMLAALFYGLAFLASLVSLFLHIFHVKSLLVYLITCLIIAIGLLFVLPLYRFFRKQGAPGAGDNLLSSVLCTRVAEKIKQEHGALQHTRLILLSTDGEECGQKGAQAFIKHHKSELLNMKTFSFIIDSLYNSNELTFLVTDRNGTVKLSSLLLQDANTLAQQLGYKIKNKTIPPGGGGTDAGQFANAGIESLSLIGISTDFIRKNIVYHTSRDVVENIDPVAVETAFHFLEQFIIDKDTTSFQVV